MFKTIALAGKSQVVHSKIARQRMFDWSGSVTVTPACQIPVIKALIINPYWPSSCNCFSASDSGFIKRPISGFVVSYQSPAKIRFSLRHLLRQNLKYSFTTKCINSKCTWCEHNLLSITSSWMVAHWSINK